MIETSIIREIIKKREVDYLYHFTRVDNLKSIFSEGLLSVDRLRNRGIKYHANDSERRDGHTDSVCLSVGFPNYLMFYNCRMKPENYGAKWVVLRINPYLLCDENNKCLYAWTNASSSHLDYFWGDFAFEDNFEILFTDNDRFEDWPRRYELEQTPFFKPCYTTDPQAEILVKDRILSADILTVCFETDDDMYLFSKNCPVNIDCLVNKPLFDKRVDWYDWKRWRNCKKNG